MHLILAVLMTALAVWPEWFDGIKPAHLGLILCAFFGVWFGVV